MKMTWKQGLAHAKAASLQFAVALQADAQGGGSPFVNLEGVIT